MPVEYKGISSGEGVDIFSKQVAELLNQGWKLQGGVHAALSKGQYINTTYYTQALTREMAGGGKKKNATRKNARSRK